MAYGFLGLLPEQFWRLTLAQFNALVRARQAEERRQGARKAAEVWALIYGWRAKKPSPQKIVKLLVGRDRFEREEFADMIDESNRRAEKAKTCRQDQERP